MQDYNTIIGTIQMRLNKCPTRSVMDRYRIGSGTVALIMNRYESSGHSFEELRMMPPKEVEDLFYPQANLQRKDIPLPDFQAYFDRIHAPYGKTNLSYCWLEYKEKNPDGYEKSQFYEYYNRFICIFRENCASVPMERMRSSYGICMDEQGIEFPSTKAIRKIADYFDVGVDWLAYGDELAKDYPVNEGMIEFLKKNPEVRKEIWEKYYKTYYG